MAGYTVHEAEIMAHDDLSALKKEYTRLRDIAQKRVSRLQKAFPNSKASQHFYDTGKKDKYGKPIYASGFQKLRNLDPKDYAKAFSELSKFVGAKAGSVSGQRAIKNKTIATWQKQGLNLNAQNYDKAIQILEEMRKQKITYGSDKVVELADAMLELDDQQTNDFLDHLDIMLQHSDELKAIDDLEGYSFEEVLELIGE